MVKCTEVQHNVMQQNVYKVGEWLRLSAQVTGETLKESNCPYISAAVIGRNEETTLREHKANQSVNSDEELMNVVFGCPTSLDETGVNSSYLYVSLTPCHTQSHR